MSDKLFNKEFQEYLDTFDNPNKHRDLLWDAWVEAIRVSTGKLITKICSICCEKKGNGLNFMHQYGYKYCPNCGRKLNK